MATNDLNPIQNSSEQLPRENGSETILSLEEEVNQDLEADSGTRVSREITLGMIAGREITSGTVVNPQRDRRVTCLRKSR